MKGQEEVRRADVVVGSLVEGMTQTKGQRRSGDLKMLVQQCKKMLISRSERDANLRLGLNKQESIPSRTPRACMQH